MSKSLPLSDVQHGLPASISLDSEQLGTETDKATASGNSLSVDYPTWCYSDGTILLRRCRADKEQGDLGDFFGFLLPIRPECISSSGLGQSLNQYYGLGNQIAHILF